METWKEALIKKVKYTSKKMYIQGRLLELIVIR